MAWRIWGDGEPLVLGHGATGSWIHWVRNIPLLSESRMVIAADMPGHGDSALPETRDHAGISKALAEGLRESLGNGSLPVDLIGFSFGGVAFSWLAKQYPEVARRLILIGCGGLDTPHGEIRLGRVSGLEGEARWQRMHDNLLGLMLHHSASVDDVALWQMLDGARATRLDDAPKYVLPDKLLLALADVTCRVDAIWGEFDRPHADPAVQEAALRRVKPDADFRVIEGAGHWAMFERPEAVNAVLLEMLDG
ncbi:MAG: alpha/beta hydrolase [Xanthobacteraceae bacterium]